jgi:hypothetical protein
MPLVGFKQQFRWLKSQNCAFTRFDTIFLIHPSTSMQSSAFLVFMYTWFVLPLQKETSTRTSSQIISCVKMELYPLFQKRSLLPLSAGDGMTDSAVTVLTYTVALGVHCSVQGATYKVWWSVIVPQLCCLTFWIHGLLNEGGHWDLATS